MKKYTKIHKLSDNKFLNLFRMEALTDSGRPFDYFFVSRRKADKIKLLTGDSAAEGVVIYPVLREDPEKIVMIRQYRYPLGDYLYELPAGLIDAGETPDIAAVREMKEETGLDFEVYAGGDASYRRPFFMGAGFTDESCNAVFGYASGTVSRDDLEDTESIQGPDRGQRGGGAHFEGRKSLDQGGISSDEFPARRQKCTVWLSAVTVK